MGRRAVAALTAGTVAGLMASTLMPVLLADYRRDLALSRSQAGLVATAALLAAAMAAFAAIRPLSRRNPRPVGTAALLLAAVGFLLAAALPGWQGLTAGQVVAGIGSGVAGATANAAVAVTPDPDRMTALAMFWSTLMIAALLAALPPLTSAGGRAGSFAMLGLVCLLLAPLSRWLPRASGRLACGSRGPRRQDAMLLLCAGAIFTAGESGLWALSAEIAADQAGMSTGVAAAVLSGAVLAGMPASLAVARLADRYRRMGPLLVTIVIGTLCKVVFAVTASPVLFTVAQLVWGAVIVASLTYLVVAAAVLDVRGRWAAAMAGALSLGGAVGPALTGVVDEASGHRALAVLELAMAAAVVGMLLLMGPAARRGGEPATERITA
ncbi:MFS transporter [Actinomadura sp. 9N215]|uniref:MFS transporter n=1 Tax=Actinomadura sp. 9N215 TaxID=3375150 RepID=UPI0037AC4782